MAPSAISPARRKAPARSAEINSGVRGGGGSDAGHRRPGGRDAVLLGADDQRQGRARGGARHQESDRRCGHRVSAFPMEALCPLLSLTSMIEGSDAGGAWTLVPAMPA